MEKRLLVALAIVVMLLFLGATLPRSKNTGERIAEAIDSAQSYRISTQIWVKSEGVVDGTAVDFTEEVKAVGATDVSSQRMVMSAVAENALGVSETITLYLIGDTIYVKSGGQWAIQKAPQDYGVWERRYQLKQLANIINNSRLSLISQSADSTVFSVEPDRDLIVEYIREQANPSGYAPNQAADVGESLKDVKMNITVDEKTLLPSEFRMTTVMERGSLSRTTEILMEVWGYDKKVEISLPDEIPANLSQQAS